jgi:hypothetical protein
MMERKLAAGAFTLPPLLLLALAEDSPKPLLGLRPLSRPNNNPRF